MWSSPEGGGQLSRFVQPDGIFNKRPRAPVPGHFFAENLGVIQLRTVDNPWVPSGRLGVLYNFESVLGHTRVA